MENKPFTGAMYLCSECGNLFNNVGLKCPTCALKAQLQEMVELGVATASMCEDRHTRIT